jgi:hypothetical protein
VFENLFNKNNNLGSTSAESAAASANATHDEQPAAGISAEETAVWQARIGAAGADDAALLQLAQQAPTVPLKLAAIEALTQESSFKQAMHDFREQDKRLYRAAKSRYEAASGKRIATEEARTLIAGARTLLEQELIPVNRVVELDRAWTALNVALLDSEVTAEFTALSEQLGTRVRAHSERGQTITRWLAAVDSAMAALQSVLPGVAQGDVSPTDTEAPAVTLLELVHGAPDAADTRCIDKSDAGKRLLALASSVVERAKFLLALPTQQAADEADEKARIEQWREFPEISDGELHTVLAHRFADWRNASSGERQREHEALSAQERAQRAEKNKQRTEAVQRDIEAAEAAQGAGHVADLTKLLGQIDHALKRGPVNASLTQRIDALRREQRRLHEWQRWSGGQGREQLAAEAQALAEQAGGKVAIKAHAEAIEKLRERWKEIDKLGGASNQTVWLAFDGALKAAYVPVAAHLDKLKAAREENLAAREAIVTNLREAAAKFFPAAQEGAPSVANTAPDWRALAHTLEEAQLSWRKLGPVEHTVPRKMLQGDKAITTRYAAAVQALEAPLKNAHSEARTRRETLVAEAKTLAAADVTARDVIDKVRKLQTQWQSVAKAQPLPRRDENALWGAFKAATDSIFTARDAARAASEAEFTEKLKARESIVDSLGALRSATTAADIKRALAEADTTWRAAPDVPKAHAAKLDARYRAARDAASQRIGEITAQAAQARYEALIAKIALCEEREKLLDAPDSNGTLSEEQAADLEARWNAVAQFPDSWNSKLNARFAGVSPSAAAPVAVSAKASKNAGESLPDVLLNLEVACSIESPAEFQAARQLLKIRALKNAMEGRQATVTTPADIERWLLDAAAYAHADETSRARLAKIIAAVRVRRPG